jgi:hypothetical protein
MYLQSTFAFDVIPQSEPVVRCIAEESSAITSSEFSGRVAQY